jgi:hypothetical protein
MARRDAAGVALRRARPATVRTSGRLLRSTAVLASATAGAGAMGGSIRAGGARDAGGPPARHAASGLDDATGAGRAGQRGRQSPLDGAWPPAVDGALDTGRRAGRRRRRGLRGDPARPALLRGCCPVGRLRRPLAVRRTSPGLSDPELPHAHGRDAPPAGDVTWHHRRSPRPRVDSRKVPRRDGAAPVASDPGSAGGLWRPVATLVLLARAAWARRVAAGFTAGGRRGGRALRRRRVERRR